MTKPFIKDKSKAKVLVIGHDPRLQKSDNIADKSFYADYFFKPIPTKKSERAKYNLASNLFSYIGWLTNYKYTRDNIYITNLCNESLPHPDKKGKTVLIPEHMAKEGIEEIKKIISLPSVRAVEVGSKNVIQQHQH